MDFHTSEFNLFLDLAIAKYLQSTRMSTRMVSDDDDVLTTTGYTC